MLLSFYSFWGSGHPNKLSLNIEKTKYMIFHFKQKSIENIQLNIKIQDIAIEKVSDFCFLGLTINENLNWKSHLNKVSNKISRTLGVMNRLKHFLTTDTLRTIYNSLILPHLNYCILVWGFECKRIQKIQKKCVRVITASKFNSHSEPLFKALNLLKVEDIFKSQSLKFYHKHVNDKLPSYFSDMFISNSSVHNYRTRQHNRIHVPPARTSQARHCVRHLIPNLLSEIPPRISEKFHTHSSQGFSTYVKGYYLGKYEADCNIQNCYICQH